MHLTDQQKAELKRAFKHFKKDIPLFAKHMFGQENALRPKQIEFAEKFRDNMLITFRGGVGFGKTRAMAVVIIWALMLHDDIKITVFGPSENQIKSGLWSEIRSLCGKLPEEFKDAFDIGETKIKRLERPDDCFAELRMANKENVENARGIHKRNNFIFVDEATGVPDEVFQVLINILADKNSKLCLISNPSATSGFFYDTWMDSDIAEGWAQIHGRATDNPDMTPDKLAKMEALYGGRLSRNYRIMIEGEFPLASEDGPISRGLVQRALDRDDVVPAPTMPIIWGLDPAGAGGDRSVLLKRHDNKIIEEPTAWRGLDPTQLAYKVRDLYQATAPAQRPAVIAVDSIGIGNGVWAVLRDWGLPVEDVNVSRAPTRGRGPKGDMYSRLRDQLWWECKEWFMTENVSIPFHKELIDELCAPTYDDDGGKIKVEDKKSLRKRIKVSPDFADALCLTFAVDTNKYVGKYAWSKPLQAEDLSWLH